MNSNKNVYRFANDIYENNVNMLAIYDAEYEEINDYEKNLNQAFLNNFVVSCNEEGIRKFEAIFNILPDEENETLEYRKKRVIAKFSSRLPYTKFLLREILNEAFGEENVDLKIKYNDYEVEIGVENNPASLINRTIKELREEIIPANIGITQITYEPYMHRYLRKYYTHEDLQQFTQGDLSQYAE